MVVMYEEKAVEIKALAIHSNITERLVHHLMRASLAVFFLSITFGRKKKLVRPTKTNMVAEVKKSALKLAPKAMPKAKGGPTTQESEVMARMTVVNMMAPLRCFSAYSRAEAKIWGKDTG